MEIPAVPDGTCRKSNRATSIRYILINANIGDRFYKSYNSKSSD